MIRVLILAAALLAGCSLRGSKTNAAAKPSPPKPAPIVPAPIEHDAPYSVVQTVASLPSPQPIPPGADAIVLPSQPAPAGPEPEKPRPVTRRDPPVQAAPPPAASTTPEPNRPRIRMIESADERRRVQNDVETRRREAEAILAQVRRKPLSVQHKDAVDRIQAFLDQAATALRRNDLQEADALSSRAVLLSRDLPRD